MGIIGSVLRVGPMHYTLKVIAACAAASAFIISAPRSSQSQTSWISIGKDTEDTRYWVQKHNWQGQYRIYETKWIEKGGREGGFLWVADCLNWLFKAHDKYGDFRWEPVLENTMAEKEFKFVCN